MGLMITFSVAVLLRLLSGTVVAQPTTGTRGNGSLSAAVTSPPAMPLTASAAPTQSATGLSKVPMMVFPRESRQLFVAA
jgi:hypothetical protein